MTLRIYNTLTRAPADFFPIEKGRVRMYVCGVTVYDRPHIGNVRSAVAFDVARRWLEASGMTVEFVRNITDIDDKMIRRAVENGETVRSLADRMTALMYSDYDALGILRPTHDPRATDFIAEMVEIVQLLERNNLAYRADSGDVNFSVRALPGYGKLSGKSLDELRAGERVAVLEGKQDPLDFVLWKSAKPTEPQDAKWESPFGLGRPGWHIECSAMAHMILGQPIDIHGGGTDLVFPHHENEIAQSEGAFGVPLANVWMHNGFLNIDGEKMSKSLGNFFSLPEVLALYDAETVRFFLVRGHYRSELGWSDKHLDDARASLRRLYTALDLVPADNAPVDWADPYAARFKAAMDNDFGTPEAVAVLFDIAGEVNRTKSAQLAGLMKSLGAMLGILQGDPKKFLQWRAISISLAGQEMNIEGSAPVVEGQLAREEIQRLIDQRAAAKAAKNFAQADRIRDDLLAQGIVLKDSPTGTSWESAS